MNLKIGTFRNTEGGIERMSNRQDGNQFETEFCEMLFKRGFWVHNLAQNKSGQPADVIAVKNGNAFLIDCKVCAKDTFTVTRVEPNQASAMELWNMCCNGIGWFAIKIRNEVYMMDYDLIRESHGSTLNYDTIKTVGTSLERWIVDASDY